MRKLNCLFIIFIIFFTSFHSFSQSKKSYAEILFDANKLYEQGQFSSALDLSISCTNKNVPESERWKAQRLLAMIYIADNKPDMARKSAEEMLELNPTYKPSQLNDPAQLIKLIKSVVVIPKLSLGMALSIGTNSTFPEITKQYVLADYNKTYTSQNSFQFGVSVGYNFNSKMSVDAGVYSSQNAYLINYEFANWKVAVANKLTYLNVPILLNYTFFPHKNLRLFVQGGAFAGKLLYSVSDFTSTYNTEIPNELKNLNTISSRNDYQFGLIGGLGARYELGQGNLFAKVNYNHSFTNISKSETRYKYPELSNTFYYADDDVLLRSVSISVGYAFYMNYKVIRK